jgi:hypothetical protein
MLTLESFVELVGTLRAVPDGNAPDGYYGLCLEEAPFVIDAIKHCSAWRTEQRRVCVIISSMLETGVTKYSLVSQSNIVVITSP